MIKAKSIVKSAMIFRHGAEITRSASIELRKGDNILAIEELPVGTVSEQARLFFPSSVSCSNIRFAYGSNNQKTQEIEEAIASIKTQIEILGIQVELIKSNGVFKDASSQDIDRINGYIDALPSRLGAIYTDIAAKNKEIKRLEESLVKEQQKQGLLSCIVDLHCEADGTYPFELHCHDNNASWEPVHEIHCDAKNPVEIRMRARISQTTGEDWTNVSISLCSGNPSLDNTLPILRPTYLSIKQEQLMRAYGAMPANSMMMGMAAAMPQAMAPMQRMETKEATVSDEETMTEYILPGTRDLPSRSEGTMADLQKFEIPATYRYHGVPLMSPKAYLVASVKVKDMPQISGNIASVYLNNVFLGQVNINVDYAKEDYTLSLGIDERIKLSRKLLKKQDATSLLKGQKITSSKFELAVANNKNTDIDIVVNDQIPVSRDKTIIVDIESIDGAERNEETGILTWTLSLKPQETKKVSFSYKVSSPKDKTIAISRNSSRICPKCGASATGKFCPECGSVIE